VVRKQEEPSTNHSRETDDLNSTKNGRKTKAQRLAERMGKGDEGKSEATTVISGGATATNENLSKLMRKGK
jgi:hypothetical protein